METVRRTTISQSRGARLYRMRCALWFLFWMLLGCFVAYGEHERWFPFTFSALIRVDRASIALFGACLTQTAALPILFALGLHRSSYFYTSRALCAAFWFLHGVELLNIILELRSALKLVLFTLLFIFMLLIMLRAVTLAARGVAPRRTAGIPVFSYCYYAMRLWGALLIVQFIFYLLVLWIT